MAISESQLATWAAQGSKTQSATTYSIIKNALEDTNAPFHSRKFGIFLQGSYGNDTNIFSDSDVDIVICLTSTFYPEIDSLSEDEKAAYNKHRSGATYGFVEFRQEVFDWLRYKFGNGVNLGKKAIFIPGNTSGRRDADVLACAEHRRYTSYSPQTGGQYHSGIIFWTTDGKKIINFPKQHSRNCTEKHQDTNSHFKANVRVIKNLRNAMIQNGYILEGVAPSYFLEGMLWNVPNNLFENSYQKTFMNSIAWLDACDPKQLACANNLHWLVRDNQEVCWNQSDFRTFIQQAKNYWN